MAKKAKKPKKTVFVARIEHKHGDNEAAFSTESKARDYVLAYVHQSCGDLPAMLGRECKELIKARKAWSAIALYFDYMSEQGREFYGIRELVVDGEDP